MPKSSLSPLRARPHVLLYAEAAEDHAPLLDLLNAQGLRVSRASSWLEVTRNVQDTAPSVLIAVIPGPVTHASDLIRVFRELNLTLPVLVMGPFPRPEDQLLLLRQLQAFDVLPPPPEGFSALPWAIQNALQYRQRLMNGLWHSGPTAKTKRKVTLHLTPRESDIIALVAEGLSNKQVGERLQLSEFTVRNGLARIFNKLGVQTRLQAINRARELHLL